MCAVCKSIWPVWTHIDQEQNRCKTIWSYLTIMYWDACCYSHCLCINACCKCCDILLYEFLSPTSNSRYCKPLVVAALEGLQERFKDMMAEPELLLPSFSRYLKTAWTFDENLWKLGRNLCMYVPILAFLFQMSSA